MVKNIGKGVKINKYLQYKGKIYFSVIVIVVCKNDLNFSAYITRYEKKKTITTSDAITERRSTLCRLIAWSVA